MAEITEITNEEADASNSQNGSAQSNDSHTDASADLNGVDHEPSSSSTPSEMVDGTGTVTNVNTEVISVGHLEADAMEATEVIGEVNDEEPVRDTPPAEKSSKSPTPVEVAPTPAAAAPVAKQSRAAKKGEKKAKRKEEKIFEAFVDSLSSLSPEEKVATVLKKCNELTDEKKILLLNSKQNERKASVALMEKNTLQLEHSKTLLAKNKLESLCRELQKYNKELKEESTIRARLDEEKRKEIAANFQGSLVDIEEKMSANHETNKLLRDENLDLQKKLKGLIGQYEKAQNIVEREFKQNKEMAEELKKLSKEKEILMLELQQCYKKSEIMGETEKQLRQQLESYSEKYNEFQTSLQTSNQVFQSFKGEMEKMTGKIKKLEKESTQWKKKAEDANKAVMAMIEDKARNEKEKNALLLKNQRLEQLCRAMQARSSTSPENTTEQADAKNAEAETEEKNDPGDCVADKDKEDSESSDQNVETADSNGAQQKQETDGAENLTASDYVTVAGDDVTVAGDDVTVASDDVTIPSAVAVGGE